MRVVVGIDLRATEHDWLIERAAVYASRLGARLDLVYCAGGPETPDLRGRLEALRDLLPERHRGDVLVLTDPPAEGLVALSKQVDMLIVGSREPLATARLLRGPMASRVLKHAHCPVLVPRGEREPAVHPRLLVGVDVEGPAPTAVLKWADRWAEQLDGTVHILYAAQTHRGDFVQTKDAIVARLQAMLEAHIREGRRGSVVVKRGEPEEVLTQTSDDYDLLLVGNRDREGLARIVLGAVAGAIVRRANCDVLSIPTATVGDPDQQATPISAPRR